MSGGAQLPDTHRQHTVRGGHKIRLGYLEMHKGADPGCGTHTQTRPHVQTCRHTRKDRHTTPVSVAKPRHPSSSSVPLSHLIIHPSNHSSIHLSIHRSIHHPFTPPPLTSTDDAPCRPTLCQNETKPISQGLNLCPLTPSIWG